MGLSLPCYWRRSCFILRLRISAILLINHERGDGTVPVVHVGSERELVNWAKQQRKLMNAGELKESRIGMFKELMELSNRYKRKNQYV